MKALVLTGVKEFEIRDLDTPEILPNEVLINTAYAARITIYMQAVRVPHPQSRQSCLVMRTPALWPRSVPR